MDEPQYYVEQQDEDLTPHRILDETPNWWITEKGMVSKRTEGDPGGYEIVKRRVGEADWIAHMADKVQIDPLEFVEALYRARALYGVGAVNRSVAVTLPLYHLYQEPHESPDVDLRLMLEDVAVLNDGPAPTAVVLVDPASAAKVRDRHEEYNRV